MKLFATLVFGLSLLLSSDVIAQNTASQRAWKPFFASFQAAVKKRDRTALEKMMSRDFYYLSSGGDENGNEDTRDEAFEYWQSTGEGSWQNLDKTIAAGTVVNTAIREPGNTLPSRIAPPLANNRRAIANRSFEWYAVFEFRDGKWYWVAFTECCE